jgi:drug/metabolite transporter (DMT)-like permease
MMTAFLRLFFGAVFVAPLVLMTAGPRSFRLTKKELGAVILIGIVGLGLNNYCYMTAMQELGIASAAVLDYTAPGFLVLLSAVFFKDKLTARKLLAVLLNFGGCAVMVTGGNFSELTFSPFGLAIGLLAGLSFALNNLFTRAFAKDMEPFPLTFYGFLFGAIALAPLVAPWHGFGFAPSTVNVLVVCGFGLIPTACGFGLYYKGVLDVRDKSMAPVISSVENIVACLLGFIVLGEYFNLWKAAGIAMVLVSIFMIARADKKTAA